ncbi:hypothetical protein G6F68_019329 [Rhizopus microsporus]|nr:hypothetical protein G6F68_019329 [Rhizopus microsporus]
MQALAVARFQQGDRRPEGGAGVARAQGGACLFRQADAVAGVVARRHGPVAGGLRIGAGAALEVPREAAGRHDHAATRPDVHGLAALACTGAFSQ